MSTPVFGALTPLPSNPFQARKMSLPAWRPAGLLPRKPSQTKLAQGGMADKAIAVGAMALPTALAAASSFVGFRLATKEEGFPMVLGYVVGIAGGLAALWGLLGMLGVATLPASR